MADDNKPLKYARYAIGEIVLVVIGILIALQVNTWNEERKNQEKLKSIFIEIQDDLSKDILRLDEILIWYKEKDSIIYLVVNDSLTIEDYSENKYLSYLTHNFDPFHIHDNGFKNLMNNIDYLKPSHKAIIDNLKNLYIEKKNNIDKFNEELENEVLKNIRKLAENKKWAYKTGQGLTAEMKEYYVNDPFYKNSVAVFETLLFNFKFLEYRSNASVIYADLSKITGRKMELPDHILNSIHDTDILKNYVGVYKQLDSEPPFYGNITTDEQNIYWGEEQEGNNVFQIARDTFGIDQAPNAYIIFKRDPNKKITGYKFVHHNQLLMEFEKTE